MTGAQPDEQPQLSILRIKRKRTHQPTPLDALVIEHAQPPSTKRRKNNPADSTPQAAAAPPRGIFRFAETVPLDSFSTPTKTRSLRDRIQSFLAHPPPALSRQHSSSSLRSLARDRDREASPSSSSLAPRKPAAPAPGSPARRKLPSALRAAREAAAARSSAPPSPLGPSSALLPSTSSSFGLSPSPSAPARPLAAPQPLAPAPAVAPSRADAAHASRAALRYRVVERRRAESYALERARSADEVRRGLRPPTVRDAGELAREREDERAGERERGAGLRVYEAEAVVEAGEGRAARKAKAGEATTRRKKAVAPLLEDEQGDGDAAMDRFGEMLDEYLSLQEAITPSPAGPPRSSTASSRRPPAPAPAPDSDDDDSDADSDSGASFVYDVYYRAAPAPAPAPARASASAPTPTAGAQGAQGVASSELRGGEGGAAGAWDVSSLAGLTRIGQLAGLDPDEDDAALLLLHSASSRAGGGGGGGDSGDSDEEEDCADQDSNEENDYRNDYPDEEDADLDADADAGFDADDAAAWRESVRGAGPRAGGGGGGGGGGWSDDDDDDEDGQAEGTGDDEGMSDEGWSD